MKKVWIYKRKNVKGWWVGWYESGQRKTKAVPTKALAEHYCQIKYTQLNSDIFTGIVVADWLQMTEEYLRYKKVVGVTEASLYESALTLRHFERVVGRCNSKQITQDVIDKFILDRCKEVKRSTLNKDITNMKTFINWCRKNRYLNGDIELHLLKIAEKPVKSLNSDQVKRLVLESRFYRTMRIRLLLALGTGLRKSDIESLEIEDIDFTSNYITTKSKKTKKSMGARPVSALIVAELSKYVAKVDADQERLFNDKFNRRQWEKICTKAGMVGFKFHDLRKYAEYLIMPSKFTFS